MVSCDCVGKRKMSEHCRPEYELGISKLKMGEMSAVTSLK
jgi:hypothetical protein